MIINRNAIPLLPTPTQFHIQLQGQGHIRPFLRPWNTLIVMFRINHTPRRLLHITSYKRIEHIWIQSSVVNFPSIIRRLYIMIFRKLNNFSPYFLVKLFNIAIDDVISEWNVIIGSEALFMIVINKITIHR